MAPELVASIFELVGSANVALVTDAMAAAGMPDGAYLLGSLDVTVSGGVAAPPKVVPSQAARPTCSTSCGRPWQAECR